MTFENAETLSQNKEALSACKALLYQLADDDFLLAYRGSEWLGLAPHIEEDVAFSSISQDTMGHAVMFYQLLEELGEGEADRISHLRTPAEFRNAILLEMKNGEGSYVEKPDYDWAFAVVRNLFYDYAKMIRLQSLKSSSYEPLAHMARRIISEEYYHLMHWEMWFRQLMTSTPEARERMEQAIRRVWSDFGGVLTTGPEGKQIAAAGLMESEEVLTERWIQKVSAILNETGFQPEGEPGMKSGNGRTGEHTEDLTEALAILSEVYRKDPAAQW
ncbi:1,2-phenylacetyl-CoA epoxidase subunit PaaC [Alteribacter natronophilus]|uniref:1,2-phenylacetyl-CoA epoxidase subunit PaaC n=1 Tax=Alteribacter natronophilus TaxID=2583810 RepID=UPI00110EF07F|nr:1,2-phenylacetyl-CoA epoxidase subunit PaaC [Alteribacter natronophilus]TMW73057.1 phenylacetate-CoA oxygenase subunit PaaC [Alteribacter natronophilus]